MRGGADLGGGLEFDKTKGLNIEETSAIPEDQWKSGTALWYVRRMARLVTERVNSRGEEVSAGIIVAQQKEQAVLK